MSRNLSYNDINHILKHGSKDKELQELVVNLQQVTEGLHTKYKKCLSHKNKKLVSSEKIVHLAMVLTGNRVATLFADAGYPCIYRVQKLNKEKMTDIRQRISEATSDDNTWNKQLKRLYYLTEEPYSQVYYDLSGEHIKLGLDHYCHCTSGLRRASDIVVEHALEVCFDKEPTDNDLYNLELEIKERTKQINAKEKLIALFEQDYQKKYVKRRN